jgi:signal transduction histidine kinase
MSMNEETQGAVGPEEEAESALSGTSDDRRGSHLGFVAHEIRNPLSTALWTAELLGRMDGAERGGARGEKLAAMCLRSLQRVRYLVEDHLLTERLDAGSYPVRAEVVSIVDAVVTAEGRRAVGEQPIELDVAPEVAVLADRTLLGRLIDTLLDAAAQGAAAVKVGASASDGEVVLTVRGAPAEPRLLEDPMKGAASDTRGRALALPAARRIAVRMGGQLVARGGAWALTLPEALGERPDEG